MFVRTQHIVWVVVITPEKKLEIIHEKTEGLVTVLCRALNVYPQPKIAMYKISDQDKEAIPETTFQIVSWNGAFDITATADFKENYLDNQSQLECEISLPDTNYSNRQRLHYYPGSQASLSSNSITSLECQIAPCLILLLAGFVTT